MHIAVEEELTTNYTAVVTLIKFFMPHFLELSVRVIHLAHVMIELNLFSHFCYDQGEGKPSFIVPVSSNLAIVPAPHVPNYCATKAAVHSLALTLDKNLKDTNVHVMEILPP